MSIWTHVNGIIRVDALRGLGIPGQDFKVKDFGDTVSYEDEKEKWDKCNVPCGSEGSLTVLLWTNPHEDSIAAYTISIFGDLRSYDNEQEIVDYFNKIVKDKMIRQGVFSFYVEETRGRTFVYNDNDKVFEEIFYKE